MENFENNYIVSFDAQKVWGYKTFEWFDINTDVNILVGINGCGKTTLLNMMYYCATSDLRSIRTYYPYSISLFTTYINKKLGRNAGTVCFT